jgi:hypothetical protein
MGLVQLLTDPGEFKFYYEKQNPDFVNLNNVNPRIIPFGQDQPGGGSSNHPFIVKPIGGSGTFNSPLLNFLAEANPLSSTDFLLRGGIDAPKMAADDFTRLSKFFFTPEGINFSLKQLLLSRTGVKTETTKGSSYLGGGLNEGFYNPLLSTLPQAAGGFLGTHYEKQGIDPEGLIVPDGGLVKYQTVIGEQNNDNYLTKNRLVVLTDLIAQNITDSDSLNGVTKYKLNNPGNGILLSYAGGPGALLGVGDTLIKYATDAGGVNPLKSGKPKEYLVGKPVTQIEPDKFQIPVGVSNAYNTQKPVEDPAVPILATGEGLGLFNTQTTTYQYNFPYSVYNSGTLSENTEVSNLLTQSYDVINRTKVQKENNYTSPINSILAAAGAGSTSGVEGSGRQILTNPVYNEALGHYVAVSPGDAPVVLGQYTSSNTLFNDNLNQKYTTSPKTHKRGYLANLDKNSGYYFTSDGKLSYVLNQYPRGIAPDFRKTSRAVRGFIDSPEGEFTNYDQITSKSDYLTTSTTSPLVDRIYYGGNTQTRTSANIDSGTDLIDFRIQIINPTAPNTVSEVLKFRAYIDDFSDSYNAGWKDQAYMGRAEKFYRYESFDRDISLGFTIVADSKSNLDIMYKQLNTLASSLSPTYTAQGYMAGNLHRVTVGNYINGQWGIIRGMQFSVSKDSPWEISTGKQLPFYIEVSGIKFQPIHNFRPEMLWGNTKHQYINQSISTV